MPTRIVGLQQPAHVRLRRAIPFRATREQEARVPFDADGDERREESLVCCQRGAPLRRGADCQACPRFLGWRDDSAGLRVRCGWSSRDRVRDCMTLAGALVVTKPGATCAEAARLAERHRVDHLLVVDGLWLVGVLSTRDLRLGGWVADRMTREIIAILGDATLGEALAAMVALDVGILPVIGERFVIGVVTRGDLLRVGVPPQLFAPPPRTLTDAQRLEDSGDDEPPAPTLDDDSDLISLPDDTLA